MSIEDFAEEVRQEVLSRSADDESGHFREDVFTEVMIEYLTQAGEVDEGEICYYRHTSHGEKLNGSALSGDGEHADLFVSCYHGTIPPPSVPNSEVKTHYRWLRRFLETALRGGHRDLEESAPVFDVAQRLRAQRNDLSRARLFLLTDGMVRTANVDSETVANIELRHHLWDLEKLR